MSNILQRIKNRLDNTRNTYQQDKEFSRKLADYRILDELSWRAHFTKLSGVYHKKKDVIIEEYIENSIKNVIDLFVDDTELGENVEHAPIWVCWWSGIESAPVLVQQCVKSIVKNAGELHPVHFITEKNYSEYLDIPEYILSKMENGQMCIANFSDYLRISLLEKYGGLWLDSTIYCTHTIPEDYFISPVFSCKSEYKECRFISKYRWTSFCIGGRKHNVFFRFFKAAFEEYWKKENASIDYLFVDYLIDIGNKRIPSIKRCFDMIPVNNIHRDDLQAAMNARLSENDFVKVLQEDTIFYKLSWREHYEMTTLEDNKSIYSHFINMEV